jgi:basic membrane lipoprotein Med (substrate-binding protein (PBP1-ABC) superfamily)
MAVGSLVAACGGTTGESEDAGPGDADGKPVVYAFFGTPLEEPWVSVVDAGFQKAADEGEIIYKHTDNLSTPEALTRAARDVLTNGEPSIITGDSYVAEEQMRELAEEFPEVQFAMGSGDEATGTNFSTFDSYMQDPAYLAGMLAGGMSKSDTIGIVAGLPIPTLNAIINSFVYGVKETNPDATVKVSFINSFFDPAAAKSAAEAQIAAGADVLYGEREGVIAAAEDAHLPVIGSMVDQHEDAPDNVVTSVVWDLYPTVEQILATFDSGKLEGIDLKDFSGLANGGSLLAPINTNVPGGVSQELIDIIEAKQAEFESGAFDAPLLIDAPESSIDVSTLPAAP